MRVRGRVFNRELVDVMIVDGRIAAVGPAESSVIPDCGGEATGIAPGFVDLQLNGYGGVDFNDSATTTEQFLQAVRGVRRTGVTSFCPTIITGSAAHTEQCINRVIRATRESEEVARAVVGLHIEGPYISPEDGPRGAHPREHVRPPDWDEFRRWIDLAEGQIRIVTLSPEWPGANSFIEKASDSGIVVAIGHTAASPLMISDAVRVGARMSTHLGNGSHAKIDRHPNYIWEQLADDRLTASIIVDGHHLPPSVVKCFIRAKGISRSMLVTDAIAAAGMAAGRHRLGNVEVEVTPERRVNLPGTPYLAGSVLEMQDAIGKTVVYAGITLEEAVSMATSNPANLIGLNKSRAERGTLIPGSLADLVLFDWDEAGSRLVVEKTITGN